jgi:hypothetical protein
MASLTFVGQTVTYHGGPLLEPCVGWVIRYHGSATMPVSVDLAMIKPGHTQLSYILGVLLYPRVSDAPDALAFAVPAG